MIKNIKALANRAWESHAARVQRRADYWLLNNMSARDLRDLGITRCEIRQRVYGPKLD
jgi:uncharacterized protein YjiS (DUF1127 family)